MRKVLAVSAVAAALVGSAAAASPASACALVAGVDPCVGTTTVALNAGVISGVLSLTSTPAATLAGTSALASGPLGVTTISDLRGDATALTPSSWTFSMHATDFNLVGATTPGAAQTVTADKASVYLTTVPLAAILGTATYSSFPTTSGTALALNADHTAKTVFSATTHNLNTTTFVPTLQVDTTGKTAGLYTGTVTQSVS